MEELAELRQLLVSGNTTEAIALIDELEEMGRKAIIRNIESYLIILLAHLIKHQAEQRMTNSWLASIVNAIVRIKKLNQRDRNSYYIKATDWDDYLEEAVELASLEAAKEAFGGIYSVEQLSQKFERERILTIAWQMLELTYQKDSRDLPRAIKGFIDRPSIS